MTCDALKDCIVMQVQKTFKNGQDVAESLRTKQDHPPGSEPTRQVVTFTSEEAGKVEVRLSKQLTQQGHDMECKEELRECDARKQICEDNEPKACTFAFGHCNRAMQNRIKEMTDFDSEIRNEPIGSLKAIKEKMHDPARVKHECVS